MKQVYNVRTVISDPETTARTRWTTWYPEPVFGTGGHLWIPIR